MTDEHIEEIQSDFPRKFSDIERITLKTWQPTSFKEEFTVRMFAAGAYRLRDDMTYNHCVGIRTFVMETFFNPVLFELIKDRLDEKRSLYSTFTV